mmetsp:Transcript_14799/g.50921  ORF Transcript_14799/g.50921 Transcript_14799/m.50921 type:complete len:205 (-) Transcript_14799:609-1223(-)
MLGENKGPLIYVQRKGDVAEDRRQLLVEEALFAHDGDLDGQDKVWQIVSARLVIQVRDELLIFDARLERGRQRPAPGLLHVDADELLHELRSQSRALVGPHEKERVVSLARRRRRGCEHGDHRRFGDGSRDGLGAVVGDVDRAGHAVGLAGVSFISRAVLQAHRRVPDHGRRSLVELLGHEDKPLDLLRARERARDVERRFWHE